MTEFDDRPTLSDVHLPTVQRLAAAVAIPRLELVVEREAKREVERAQVLEGDVLRIGSHPSNDVVLDDRTVSRFHLQLTRGEQGWVVSDSGSMNGTCVNGVRVRDADLPRPSCRIEIGDSVLRVQELGPQAIEELPTWVSFGELYGESTTMRQLFTVLDRVAKSEATLLIEGESGTGKELAAMEIARRGPRASGPFIIVDCSSISPNLIESELFGHTRGSFTGADKNRVGAFEAANGGTIFLDEIGEMPLEMQPKLLRALEAREIRRTGENDARKIDVRVIAATNRRLEREVNAGRFREDLYFRLGVVTVRMPSLRKRLQDIPTLVQVILRTLNAEEANHLFTPDVIEDMARYDWPGNVRELRNYVERAVVLDHAPPASERRSGQSFAPEESATTPGVGGPPANSDISVPFRHAKEAVISDFERTYLKALLDWAGGNVSKAARKAKMDRMYLYRLLQRYELRGGSRIED
ncbi:MAG: sigma 54-dependent Fis family transcriptional regulator [Myxococcales bacterium]|nr:sigma 54-dependent Fis family transcriptional regulator [Myxococcales bacterium]